MSGRLPLWLSNRVKTSCLVQLLNLPLAIDADALNFGVLGQIAMHSS